jgi:hypothetical protein
MPPSSRFPNGRHGLAAEAYIPSDADVFSPNQVGLDRSHPPALSEVHRRHASRFKSTTLVGQGGGPGNSFQSFQSLGISYGEARNRIELL